MINIILTAGFDLAVIAASFFLFKNILDETTRYGLYNRFLNSFAKFALFIISITVMITSLTSLILFNTKYSSFIDIIAPALVCILVGFIMSTVPRKDMQKTDKFPK